jgi:hypothetical protein
MRGSVVGNPEFALDDKVGGLRFHANVVVDGSVEPSQDLLKDV